MEVQPNLLFKFGHNWGLFCLFFTLQGYFWGWGQVQTLFCNIPIQTINFGFGSTALSFALILSYLGPLFGPFGAIFGLGSGSKNFLGPTYLDNQLWFWKYSPNFWFLFGHIWGLFCPFFETFGAIFFGIGVRFEILLWK